METEKRCHLFVLASLSLSLAVCLWTVTQTVSKAVSRFVPVWLKHYLRGFSTLFLKRSDIRSQPPPLPTGKLKNAAVAAGDKIYLLTYLLSERDGRGDRGGQFQARAAFS